MTEAKRIGTFFNIKKARVGPPFALLRLSARGSELLPQLQVRRHRLPHQSPEAFSMIEFLHMAKLVDDDVVAQIRLQEYQLVIEVQVPFLRA